ncbi:uncharacterized protein CTRU02_208983 [Colletotrichum truncatum]|uniref:Uncharacterized protein n=1 Tax=Colletotrichum truncatum TaxID=5467 RepID=A0ACC3YXR7_COLTU|nr:uncharacterized protein CTRU02_07823 [Colletotrichum truncatum]KAF6790917.1 hypothetical protein CTRU02_07823 [Colletotrichum truncatum]
MNSFMLTAAFLPALILAFPQIENIKRAPNGTGDPSPPPPVNTGAVCTPAKYQCRQNTDNTWGWDVCDTSSKWVNGGNCAATEICIFNSINGSPYCVPKPPTVPPSNTGQQCFPGKYQCKYDASKGWSIETCSSAGSWVHTLDCAASETCTYSPVAGYPYCTPKTDGRVCAPGTYQCSFLQSDGGWGWDVCSTEGKWVRGGACKAGETCSFNPINGSPYCI